MWARPSSCRTAGPDALAKRAQCIDGVAALMASLLKAAKKKQKEPQGEAAAAAGEAVGVEAAA